MIASDSDSGSDNRTGTVLQFHKVKQQSKLKGRNAEYDAIIGVIIPD
jgi:hypothetical protein